MVQIGVRLRLRFSLEFINFECKDESTIFVIGSLISTLRQAANDTLLKTVELSLKKWF